MVCLNVVEHVEDDLGALRNIFSALKPGGRAIVGVPNRHDPFLRPLLVAALALTAILSAVVGVDGESTWLEGLALIGLYVILAASVWWGAPSA